MEIVNKKNSLIFFLFLIIISFLYSTDALIVINNCNDLQRVQNKLSEDYALNKNIDCYNTIKWNSGKGFKPIGNFSKPFTGKFYGNNHVISNLYINRTEEDYVALFGFINNANIEKVSINKFSVNGRHFTGSLIGYTNNSRIFSSHSYCKVNASHSVGGLIGYSYLSVVSNSSSECIVVGFNQVGGFIGGSISSNISNSFSDSEVSGYEDDYSGGFVALFSGEIKNSYSKGSVYGTPFYSGGFVGSSSGNITNSYSTGNVYGGELVGGFVGHNNGNITNSFATGKVSGSNGSFGELIGFNGINGRIVNSYWLNNSYNLNYFKGNVYPSNSPFNLWDFDFVWEEEHKDYPVLKWQENDLKNNKNKNFRKNH